MRLGAEFLSEPLTLNYDSVAVLCIENKKLYRNVILAMKNEHPEEMNIIFSKDFTPFKFKSNVCFIDDYYSVSFSSAIMKKLYEEISRFCNEELQEETLKLKSCILHFMEQILQNYDYDFKCKDEVDLLDLFKIQDLKPNISNEDLLSSLLEFILIMNKYSKVKCFVLLNLHTYFTKEELAVFYKELVYNQIAVLVLENNSLFEKSSYESIRILDEDLCEIVEK